MHTLLWRTLHTANYLHIRYRVCCVCFGFAISHSDIKPGNQEKRCENMLLMNECENTTFV